MSFSLSGIVDERFLLEKFQLAFLNCVIGWTVDKHSQQEATGRRRRNRNREKREKMTKRVFERIDEKVKKGECERLNEKHWM